MAGYAYGLGFDTREDFMATQDELGELPAAKSSDEWVLYFHDKDDCTRALEHLNYREFETPTWYETDKRE